MPIRCHVAACAMLSALVLPAAAAAEDKPALAVETKSLTASIGIDDKLKPYPGLYDNLLAEGRREIGRWRVDAEKGRKEDPAYFREGHRWTFERSYQFRSAVGGYVSVVRLDGTFTGGAHPNSTIDTILWDGEAKKQISIRPFFKETADGGPTLLALVRAIRAALVAVKKERGIDVDDPATEFASVEPKLLKIGHVALAPSTRAGKSSGLAVYFSPYDVGAYAEGPYTVFVPWEAFREHLSPAGLSLFGGTRPDGDTDQD